MLKLFVHKQEVPVTIMRFPAGETGVKITDPEIKLYDREPLHVNITCGFETNDDIINLLQLTDAVKRQYWGRNPQIALTIPYFPYARQDRVCNKGESLSVKVIADLINSQNYITVYITDAHSEVTPALLNNCVNIKLDSAARVLRSIRKPENTILVSPDAGANKKVFEFAKINGYEHVVRADKTREVSTGKITGTRVYWEEPYHDIETMSTNYKTSTTVTGKDFLILDDICDGGRTFIELAKELKKLTTGNIYLYVTHGIFTKGMVELAPLFEHIYVSNLMNKEMLKRLPLNLIKEI